MAALGSVAAEARMPFLLQVEKWPEGRARSHGPTASPQAGLPPPLPPARMWPFQSWDSVMPFSWVILDLGKGIPISDRDLCSVQPSGSRPYMPLRPLW